jgi:aspartate-semialdehyde dehydrogenase
MTKLPCAVLGATGVVGQYFLALLADHPEFQVQKVCASESRTGRRIADVPRLIDADLSALGDLEFSPLDMVSLADAGIRVVFSALPADVSKQIEPQAAQAGLRVFSNASAFRMAPQVPILIPEVNADQLALVETSNATLPALSSPTPIAPPPALPWRFCLCVHWEYDG